MWPMAFLPVLYAAIVIQLETHDKTNSSAVIRRGMRLECVNRYIAIVILSSEFYLPKYYLPKFYLL